MLSFSGLLTVVVILLVIGALLYVINYRIPQIEPWVKSVINIVVIVFVLLWLLGGFGVINWHPVAIGK